MSNEINCNFDQSTFCGWRQDHVTDNFDWRLNSGTTRQHKISFLLTGPDGDHTTNSSVYISLDITNNIVGKRNVEWFMMISDIFTLKP